MPISRSTAAVVLLAVTLLLLLPLPARADEVLHFEQKTLDLGPIGDDESAIHAFPFTNASPRIVRIAMSYCHFCAPPILDKQVLQPGESATIVLELDPVGKRGPSSASVTIAEEGRPGTAVELMLKGEICPRVWVEPLNMFPRIVRGRASSATFSITGRSSKFKVEKVDSDVPMAAIDIARPVEVDDCGSKARRQDITVRFPKDLPLGRFNAALHILTSDEQARPKLVTIDGNVTGRLSFEPQTLAARLNPGEPFAKTFEVVADEGPLVLTSLDVEARDEASSIAIDAVPTADPNRFRVTVSGRAPLRERQSVDLRIRIVGSTLAEPGEESLTVPITLVVFAKNRPQ